MHKEILDVQELSARLKVGRSTVYSWIKEGVLVVGQHVIRHKSVVRFIWSDDLLEHLLATSDRDEMPDGSVPLKRKGRGAPGKIAFDDRSIEDLCSSIRPVEVKENSSNVSQCSLSTR